MRGILIGLFLLFALASCVEGDGGELGGQGEACSQGTCEEGFCYGPRGRSFCTIECDGDAACIEGFICQVEPNYRNKLCLPGARCEGDEACPSGHRCDPQTKSCFVSVQRDLCGPCTSNAQCPEGGLCVHARSTGERFCSGPCESSTDCPQGYRCRSLNQDGISYGGSERPKQCVPEAETCSALRPLCSPCEGDWECGTHRDLCLEDRATGEKVCGRACNPGCVYVESRDAFIDQHTGRACDSACPLGFTCHPVRDGHQCVADAVACAEFCDAVGPLEERIQCGLGMACDRASQRCVPAADGRTCSPCEAGACPGDGITPTLCLVNHDTGESFCAEVCERDADCLQALGVGFSCRRVEDRSLCVPDAGSCSGGGALGTACEVGEDCAGGRCLVTGERGICSGSCTEDAHCGDARWVCCALSGDGYDCGAPLDGPGVCAPRGGGFGDVCGGGRPPCEGGYCLDIGSARICTEGCVEDRDCDEIALQTGAYQCKRALLEEGEQRIGVCFPAGGGEVGSDCTFGPASCADRICLERRLGNVCSKECVEEEDCPQGWACDEAETADGVLYQVCLPP